MNRIQCVTEQTCLTFITCGQATSLNHTMPVTLRLRCTFMASQPPSPTPGGGDSLIWAILGMCGLKGYGFSAVLVINRVSILADFGHFGHKKGMVFEL